jgi:hypothetical protein
MAKRKPVLEPEVRTPNANASETCPGCRPGQFHQHALSFGEGELEHHLRTTLPRDSEPALGYGREEWLRNFLAWHRQTKAWKRQDVERDRETGERKVALPSMQWQKLRSERLRGDG